jgi:general stress protein 26
MSTTSAAVASQQHAPIQMATDADKAKLKAIVKEVGCGMLCTIDKEGQMHARPMTVNGEMDIACASGECALWFFTYGSSHKVMEINEHGSQCCLSFSHPSKHVYLSVSGQGHLVTDRAEMEKRWTPSLKEWFPKGLDEPDAALLKICIAKAEYWEGPSTMSHVVAFMKSHLGAAKDVSTKMDHKAVQITADAAECKAAK